MLLKPVVVKKGKENKVWKPSITESKEGFIIHAKVIFALQILILANFLIIFRFLVRLSQRWSEKGIN